MPRNQSQQTIGDAQGKEFFLSQLKQMDEVETVHTAELARGYKVIATATDRLAKHDLKRKLSDMHTPAKVEIQTAK